MEIESAVVAAPAVVGVTVAGVKEHEAPVGRPEHANVTAAMNPFCGVTVRLTAPCCEPDGMVSDAGLIAIVKLGGTRLRV